MRITTGTTAAIATVALAVTATALGQGAGGKRSLQVHSTTSVPSVGASQPQVTVNGQNLPVPANGTATLKQGDTKTTVTHSSADSAGAQTTVIGESTSPEVNISVTSNSAGKSHSHSHIDFTSSGGTTTSTRSYVNVQTHDGQVDISQ